MLIVWKNEREQYLKLYLSSSKIRKIDHFIPLSVYAKFPFLSIEVIGKNQVFINKKNRIYP